MGEDDQRRIEEEVERLKSKTDALSEQLKERELNLFRAAKTFWNDYIECRSGKRKDIESALWGILNSYLVYVRQGRRILIVGGIVGTLVASALTYVQLRLLSNQNTLIEQQNAFIGSQTESSKRQTISQLLSSLAADNPLEQELAVVQLSAIGYVAFPVLSRLAAKPSDLRIPALVALLGQTGIHTPREVRFLTAVLGDAVAPLLTEFILRGRRFYRQQPVPREPDPELQDVADALAALLEPSIAYFDDLSVRCRDDKFCEEFLPTQQFPSDPVEVEAYLSSQLAQMGVYFSLTQIELAIATLAYPDEVKRLKRDEPQRFQDQYPMRFDNLAEIAEELKIGMDALWRTSHFSRFNREFVMKEPTNARGRIP